MYISIKMGKHTCQKWMVQVTHRTHNPKTKGDAVEL